MHSKLPYLRFIVIGALSPILGCQVLPADEVGVNRAAITHGVNLSADRNVGILRYAGTNTYRATGTLIGRKTVLTNAFAAPNNDSMEFCDFPCGNIFDCTPTCAFGIMTHHPQFDGQSYDFAVG